MLCTQPMKRSYPFDRRAVIRFCLVLVVANLHAGAASREAFAQKEQDDSTEAQADGTNPAAINPVQKRTFSGPQPGEKLKPFKVLTVKDDQTQELEVATKTNKGITLICFVHRLSNDDRILFGLGLVDFYVSRYSSLTSHIVLLPEDREKVMTMLAKRRRRDGK